MGSRALQIGRILRLQMFVLYLWLEAVALSHGCNKYWAGSYIPALFAQKIYTPEMSEENGEAIGPETIKKTGCFSPSSDDHIQFIQQYIELGFDTIILHSPGPDQRAFIERYGHDILPKIRTMTPKEPAASYRG